MVPKYLVGQKAGYYVQYEAQEVKDKPASATPSTSKIEVKSEIKNEVKTEIKEEIIDEVEHNFEKKVEIKDDFKVIFDDEADVDFSDDVQRALEIVENFPMAKKPKLALPSEYEDKA